MMLLLVLMLKDDDDNSACVTTENNDLFILALLTGAFTGANLKFGPKKNAVGMIEVYKLV